MIPSLQALLAAAGKLYGVSDSDIRLGHDERCLGALGAYMWMAREATEVAADAAAMFAGRRLSVATVELARIDVAVRRDPHIAQLIQEALFEAAAVDEIARQKRRVVAEMTPIEIARRVLGGPATALTVGAENLRQMAAALLALDAERGPPERRPSKLRAEALRDAHRDYEAARDGPHAALMLRNLILAAGLLADELDPVSPRSTKEFSRV